MNNTITKITLHSKDGDPFAIPAVVMGGLAFHHTLSGPGTWKYTEWCVSHVASGLIVCPGPFANAQECRAYIAAITPLTDWTLGASDIHQKHGRKPNARFKNKILRAYDKACGISRAQIDQL